MWYKKKYIDYIYTLHGSVWFVARSSHSDHQPGDPPPPNTSDTIPTLALVYIFHLCIVYHNYLVISALYLCLNRHLWPPWYPPHSVGNNEICHHDSQSEEKCYLFFMGAALPVSNKALKLCSWSLFAATNMGAVIVMIISSPLQWPSIVCYQCFDGPHQTIETGVAKQSLPWKDAIHQPLNVRSGSWVMWSGAASAPCWLLGCLLIYTAIVCSSHDCSVLMGPHPHFWRDHVFRVTVWAGLSLCHPSSEPIIDG